MIGDLIFYANVAKDFIEKLNFEELVKILLSVIILVFAFVALSILYALIRSSFKVYDITLINRMNSDCKFATLRAMCGSQHIKCSKETRLSSDHAFYYQVVPGWKGLIGRYTMHIRLQRYNNDKIVIIPIYNSGDIQRSRVFFIEESGVRELATAAEDVWNWSEDQVFGQQGN